MVDKLGTASSVWLHFHLILSSGIDEENVESIHLLQESSFLYPPLHFSLSNQYPSLSIASFLLWSSALDLWTTSQELRQP